MKVLQIATVGDDNDPIMVGVRSFPVSKIILLHTADQLRSAHKVKSTVDPLRLDVELQEIEGEVLMGCMTTVAQIVQQQSKGYDETLINVSGGTRMLSCAALSAAFVNGIRAFGVADNEPFFLPVLRFSYDEVVSEAKFKLLRALDNAGGTAESLNDLAESAGIEKSLLSYHIRGGRDAKGLEQLGLVDVDRRIQGRLRIRLTPLGRLLLLGRPADIEAPPRSPPADTPQTPARS